MEEDERGGGEGWRLSAVLPECCSRRTSGAGDEGCCCSSSSGGGDSIARLNLLAALLHAAQALAAMAITVWLDARPLAPLAVVVGQDPAIQRQVSQMRKLFHSGRFPVTRSIAVWRNSDDDNNNNNTMFHTEKKKEENDWQNLTLLSSGHIDVRFIIISFFMLSALFQGIASALFQGRSGWLRYVEYGFSASAMMLAIAVEAGVRDLYTLQAMFVLVWLAQMLGLLAEQAQRLAGKTMMRMGQPRGGGGDDALQPMIMRMRMPSAAFPPHTYVWCLPHAAAWVACVSAYAPVLDSFFQSCRLSDRAPPDFVRVLIFVEFALFMCFGLVQTWALIAKTYAETDAEDWWRLDAPRNHASARRASSRRNGAAADGSDEMLLLDTSSFGTTSTPHHHDPWKSLSRTPQQPPPPSRLFRIEETAEYTYILLSLIAKTLLCWIVLSPMITA